MLRPHPAANAAAFHNRIVDKIDLMTGIERIAMFSFLFAT